MEAPPPPQPGPQPEALTRLKVGILAHPRLVLLAMVATFCSFSFAGAYIAYMDLGVINAHAYDLAIFQQALSSTAQGFHIPFYEASDCTAKARCSLLLVHPSLILYGLVPFYALAPSALTLFAARSLIVGAAAFPLYWLTRQVTDSRAKALLAAGLYLVWAPTMSGDFYSFHVESFLPLELFSLMALWQAGHYRWGYLVALLSFLTLEVAPVFTFLIGVFFLVPAIPLIFRATCTSSRTAATSLGQVRAGLGGLSHSIRVQLRRAEVRASLALMVMSLAGFVALALFMNRYGPDLLGVVSPSEPGGLAGLFFENSAGPVASSPGAFLGSSALVFTAEYWLILFALLGFLPLLSRRSWILTLPWMAVTFLAADHRFSRIGSQYTMVALVPLFIALAYGLAKLPWGTSEPSITVVPSAVVDPAASTPGASSPVVHRGARARRSTALGVFLLAVVAVNILLNPLCPIIPDTVGGLPNPFSPGYFENSTAIHPGIAWVEQMVALVPHRATIAVQNNLLPLVANDLASYRFHQYNVTQLSHLPFNVQPWPQYLLAAATTLTQPLGCRDVDNDSIPGCVSLSNETQFTSTYSVRAFVQSTPIGEVLLFELNYTGVAELFGPALAPTYVVGQGLVPGGSGIVEKNGSGSASSVIGSNLALNATGLLCRAVLGVLGSGTYTLKVALKLVQRFAGGNKIGPAVQFRLQGPGGRLLWEVGLNASQLPGSQWTVITFTATVVVAEFNTQLQISWQNLHFQVTVASLTWTPA
ncbi:MAG: DUF2079 domain-containing protein [Thermoplasmata archaeon]|nr:DUF2079 domain-containing protein [Thermoplasmata archaeon]